MNYQANIKKEYTYTAPSFSGSNQHAIYGFFADGSIEVFQKEDFSLSNTTLAELFYYVANKTNETYNSHNGLVSFTIYVTNSSGDYGSYQYYTTLLDYAVFGGGLARIYQGVRYNYIDENDCLDDGSFFTNYPSYNSLGFSNYTYGQFINGLTTGQKAVFDLSSLNYTDGNTYSSDIYTIRGENMAFYCSGVFSHTYNMSQNPTQEYFAYGSPIRDIANSEYDRGLSNGRTDGYVTGYDNGFSDGQASAGQDGHVADAFSYIGSAFRAVSNIMELEVLPNINLGLCFSIPLVFILIMTIFKLVRK